MQNLDVMLDPVRGLLVQIGSYLPRLAVALAILVAGWLLAKAFRYSVVKALRALNFHVLTGSEFFVNSICRPNGFTATV